jgi:hypothetical protein
MNGVLKSIIAAIPSRHGPWETVLARPFPDVQNPSFNSIPLLQYSNTPLLHQRRDLRTPVRPPLRGLQTKPRPLGVDSLLKFAENLEHRGKSDNQHTVEKRYEIKYHIFMLFRYLFFRFDSVSGKHGSGCSRRLPMMAAAFFLQDTVTPLLPRRSINPDQGSIITFNDSRAVSTSANPSEVLARGSRWVIISSTTTLLDLINSIAWVISKGEPA